MVSVAASFQFPVSRFEFPVAGPGSLDQPSDDWQLERGNWERKTGNWELGAGNWKLFRGRTLLSAHGVTAQLGRVFDKADNRPPAGREVVVLSDSYWRRTFGGDPQVLGQELRIGAKTFTVIGVMPAGFTGDRPEPVDAWAPLQTGAGVYALLSFMVAQRSREIGVRLALGATPAQTRRLVVGQSLRWIAWGWGAGIAAALILGRFVKPLLFETSPYDASVLEGTAALLILVACAASLLPAVRASRVDPNVALRAD